MATVRKQFSLPNSSAKTEEIQVEKNFRSMLGSIIAGDSSISVFAHIVMGLVVQENTNISTMAVTIRNGAYVLMYSPEMVKSLSVHDCSIVLAHEMAHLALSHTARILKISNSCTSDSESRKYKKLLAIAADCAVNSWLIDDLGLFTQADLANIGNGKYPGIHPWLYKLETGKSMEWYLDALASKLSQVTDDDQSGESECESGCSEGESSGEGTGSSDGEGKGEGTSGGNSGNGKSMSQLVAEKDEENGKGSLSSRMSSIPEENIDKLLGDSGTQEAADLVISEDSIPEGSSADEIYQNLVKDAGDVLKDAAKSCRDRGIDPGRSISSLLDTIYAEPKVSWKDVLRRYASVSKPCEKERSVSRPKRNVAYLGGGAKTSEYPGKRKVPTYNIVFAIDTSGSVSDSDIDLIFTELEAIASDKSTTVTVVECDSTIHRVYTLRNGRQKVTRQVYGRGGTSFDPTFELIKLGKFGKFTVDDETDLLVYATDGYCTFPTNSLRIKSTKVIWLTTTGMIPAESTWGVTPPGDSRFGMCDYGRYISIK